MAQEKKPKTRPHKESKAQHGSGGKGRPLTDMEKVLLGGGMMKNYNPLHTSRNKRKPTKYDRRKQDD